MSVVWAAIALLSWCTTGWMVLQIERRPRPADVGFAMLAPVCALIALLASVCVFVPGFLALS